MRRPIFIISMVFIAVNVLAEGNLDCEMPLSGGEVARVNAYDREAANMGLYRSCQEHYALKMGYETRIQKAKVNGLCRTKLIFSVTCKTR